LDREHPFVYRKSRLCG